MYYLYYMQDSCHLLYLYSVGYYNRYRDLYWLYLWLYMGFWLFVLGNMQGIFCLGYWNRLVIKSVLEWYNLVFYNVTVVYQNGTIECKSVPELNIIFDGLICNKWYNLLGFIYDILE